MNLALASSSRHHRSLVLYGVLVGGCIVTYLAGLWWSSHLGPVRVFGLDGLALVALGLVGVYLAPLTGFPDLLDERVPARQRWLWPALVGLLFGIGDVVFFKTLIHPQPLPGLTPFMQPFPYAVLLYAAGALETEVIHRLLPLPVGMLVLGSVFGKRDIRSERLFWPLAVLTSLGEPYLQMITDSVGLMLFSFANGFAFNLIQAVYFRRAGFLAALTVRGGHYLVWHVGFGVAVQYS